MSPPRTVPSPEAGDTFGRLTVRYLGFKTISSGRRYRAARCWCDPDLGGCGTWVTATIYALRSGNVQSCGCLQRERAAESIKRAQAARRTS